MRPQQNRYSICPLLVILVALVAACGGDGAGPSAGHQEWIAFQSHRTFNNDVWVMRPDGSRLRNVTDNPAEDIEPAFSPDGSRIAFVSDRDGSDELWVIDADGTNPIQLTSDSGIVTWPSWAPDGNRIAYERAWPSSGHHIRVVNAGGGGDTLLIADARQPAWSPDGLRIAFTGADGIYIADSAGGNAQKVDSTEDGHDAAWSPDGNRLAFTSPGHIVVIGVAGSGRLELTSRTRPDFQPSWSPDGTNLVFTCDLATVLGDLNYEICKVPAVGGTPVNLTQLAAPDMRPTWIRE